MKSEKGGNLRAKFDNIFACRPGLMRIESVVQGGGWSSLVCPSLSCVTCIAVLSERYQRCHTYRWSETRETTSYLNGIFMPATATGICVRVCRTMCTISSLLFYPRLVPRIPSCGSYIVQLLLNLSFLLSSIIIMISAILHLDSLLPLPSCLFNILQNLNLLIIFSCVSSSTLCPWLDGSAVVSNLRL